MVFQISTLKFQKVLNGFFAKVIKVFFFLNKSNFVLDFVVLEGIEGKKCFIDLTSAYINKVIQNCFTTFACLYKNV